MNDSAAFQRAATLLGPSVRSEVPLGPLTTYKVGGAARLFLRVESLDELRRVAKVVGESRIPVLIVGRGSNMLVADEGFDGLAVTFGDAFSTVEIEGTGVAAGGFTLLPVLARRTAAAGLTGLEWAVGVPGSVGGAVRMNAGGHGSDVQASLVEVTVLHFDDATEVTIAAGDLGLRFRGSELAEDAVVVSARFRLGVGDAATCEAEIAEIVRWRREHQPGGQNAGSVFVNPLPGKLAAGQVIDELGLRGFRIGSAHVSEKHANFIQSDPGGTAADVKAVIDAVRERVLLERGIDLRSEIRLVGFGEVTPMGTTS